MRPLEVSNLAALADHQCRGVSGGVVCAGNNAISKKGSGPTTDSNRYVDSANME